MALDRQSIARRDFPTTRRGYDPAAVDAHLEALAEAAQAPRAGAGAAAPLSAQTGDRVREIVEAAERSADAIREAARAEAAAHVADVERAAGALRARIAALDGELGAALDELRARAATTAAPVSSPGEEDREPDIDGARIVALEMALRGAPRTEAERYLAEHYDLPDRQALLDEVYTVAGA